MHTHQCPFCVLRYSWKTELLTHLRAEHHDFQHDYPEREHSGQGHNEFVGRGL